MSCSITECPDDYSSFRHSVAWGGRWRNKLWTSHLDSQYYLPMMHCLQTETVLLTVNWLRRTSQSKTLPRTGPYKVSQNWELSCWKVCVGYSLYLRCWQINHIKIASCKAGREVYLTNLVVGKNCHQTSDIETLDRDKSDEWLGLAPRQ